MPRILLTLLALFFSMPAGAQPPAIDTRSAGFTYIIAFPDTTTNTTDSRQGIDPTFAPRMPDHDAFVIYIYSTLYNDVQITGHGYQKHLTPEPGLPLAVFLNEAPVAPYPVVDTSFEYSDNTFRVEAKYPIVVYCYMATQFGAEAWTPLPVEAWGKEYEVAAQPGEVVMNVRESLEPEVQEFAFVKHPKEAPAELLILSAYDSTLVYIDPRPGSQNPFHHYLPQPIIMNANQAFELQSFVDTSQTDPPPAQSDISGIRIRSNRPIGVLSGNTRAEIASAQVSFSGNSFKNMLIEWLRPAEQQGTEFLYLPTVDAYGFSNSPSSLRQGEHLRAYATDTGATSGTMVRNLSDAYSATVQIAQGDFHDYTLTQPTAAAFRSDHHMQMMMNSIATNRFLGDGSIISVGPYMVEMTPYEQWPTSAPYVAPEYPPGMRHMLNIVTDSTSADKIFLQNGTRIPMNVGRIPGSRFCWGSRQLQAGEQGTIKGTDGARFYAFVYGSLQGWERFRPGKTKRDDDGGSPTALPISQTPNHQKILHPSEYEESIGISYGYPLAAMHTILRAGDSLAISRSDSCNYLLVSLRSIGENPAGIRSIWLDSIDNAELLMIDPVSPQKLIGATRAHLSLHPIDPTRNASAVIVIEDRTGKVWRLPYLYIMKYLSINPARLLDFGELIIGNTGHDSVIITNPTSVPIEVDSIMLAIGMQSFTIDSIRPAPTTTLAPGQTITVWISCAPTKVRFYYDTLRVVLQCGEMRLPLLTNGIQPCISVGDLNFGTLTVGKQIPLPLQITNKGLWPISFEAPFLTWTDARFKVSPADIARLGASTLKPGESITITVSFSADAPGTFSTTARIWATTRSCRDTSIWSANVIGSGPYIGGHDWDTVWVTSGNLCTKNDRDGYPWDLHLFQTGDDETTVGKIELIGPDADAGYFVLDTSNPATTVKPGTSLPHGDDTSSTYLTQRVLFRPIAERDYNCIVRLTTTGTTITTTENVLHGRGTESHIAIGDHDFGNVRLTGGSVSGVVELHALPSRPLTVSDLQIVGPDRADFAFDNTGFTKPDPLKPSTWWHLNPGDRRSIPLLYTPSAPGAGRASLLAATDGSRCDDSIAELTATSYIGTITTEGITFGDMLLCDQRTGSVVIRNLDSVPVLLKAIAITPNGAPFTAEPSIALPLTLAPKGSPGDSLLLPIDFQPTTNGRFSANLTFEASSADGSVTITIPSAPLSGSAFSLTGTVSPLGDRHALPGSLVTIPVLLATASTEPARADIRRIRLGLTYETTAILLDNGRNTASLLDGTLLEGWNISDISSSQGSYQATFTSVSGRPLSGTGLLANLRFRTFLGSAVTSTIRYDLDVPGDDSCIALAPASGTVTIDSICGLGFRLIEMTSGKYSLQENRPNPFTTSTAITFSVGLDGETSLVVYNAIGEKVATLVNRYLTPSSYSVTWDASSYPSGLYYYRLTSGQWSRTGTMILRN